MHEASGRCTACHFKVGISRLLFTERDQVCKLIVFATLSLSLSLSLFIEGVKGVSCGINSDYLGTSKRMRKVRAIVRFTVEFDFICLLS